MKTRTHFFARTIGILTAAMVLFCTTPAFAASGSGVLLSFNGFMYNQTRESGGSSSDDNTYIYDIKLGYLNGTGLYFGAIHTTRNHNGSAISGESGSALGASLGYMGASGFYLMGHYYFDAKLGDNSKGTGYQGDFGYMGNVSGPFYVGTELTYRNLTYADRSGGGSGSLTVKELFPMLTAAFIF